MKAGKKLLHKIWSLFLRNSSNVCLVYYWIIFTLCLMTHFCFLHEIKTMQTLLHFQGSQAKKVGDLWPPRKCPRPCTAANNSAKMEWCSGSFSRKKSKQLLCMRKIHWDRWKHQVTERDSGGGKWPNRCEQEEKMGSVRLEYSILLSSSIHWIPASH